MTHLKMLGSWVRLPDGREGHIAGSGLDGLVIVSEGKIVHALPKDVTPISPPPSTLSPYARPIQTHHTADDMPAQRIADPFGMSVLVSGKWSEPQ
jgi:hypothetical protein